MSEQEVMEQVHACQAFEGWRESVQHFIKEGFSVTEGHSIMKGNVKRDSGWFCAQRRLGRAFGWLEQVYAQRDFKLPDYLLVAVSFRLTFLL